MTGELNCLHLEWHLNGVRAVWNAGILSGADLLKWDHRAFWNKRLLLYEIEPWRLGKIGEEPLDWKERQSCGLGRLSRWEDRTRSIEQRRHGSGTD